MKITIEIETHSVVIETNCGEKIGDFINAFRYALAGVSFDPELIEKYLPDPDELDDATTKWDSSHFLDQDRASEERGK